jgi:hypothetical protein
MGVVGDPADRRLDSMDAPMKNTDTEIVFEQKVVELAHLWGWKVASFRPAGTGKGWRTPVKYDGKGYPDLTMIHEKGYIIFAEMKRETGSTMSAEQKEWATVFMRCASAINDWLDEPVMPEQRDRVFYRMWRPRDGNEIVTLLSFGRVTEWTP